MYHLNCFDLSINRQIIFAGDKQGNLCSIKANNLSICKTVSNIHSGTIQAISCHKTLNFFSCLGKDQQVSIWEYSNNNSSEFRLITKIDIRNLSIPKIDRPTIHSESQAICMHSTEMICYARTGNGLIVEINFSQKSTCHVFGKEVIFSNDIVTLKHTDLGYLLVGMTDGKIHIYKTYDYLYTIKLPYCNESIHWFEQEHKQENIFYVATDARKIYKINLENFAEISNGNEISRDDLESIACFGNRMLATSFDLNIYDIDKSTLNTIQVLYSAAFKIRWIRFIDKNNIVFQVRNGCLIKFNLITRKEIKLVSSGHKCLWSATNDIKNTNIYFGGINNSILITSLKNNLMYPKIEFKTLKFEMSDVYFKRIIEYGKFIIAASTDYNLYKINKKTKKIDSKLNIFGRSRDLCIYENMAFVALESRNVLLIDLTNFCIINKITVNCPIWSLAFNPEKKLLAFGERVGHLYIYRLDKTDLHYVTQTICRLPKRMKWVNNYLLVTHSDCIDLIEYDSRSGQWDHKINFFALFKNTIEDFVIINNKYVLCISYNKLIVLFDFESGNILDTAYDSFDYSKGIINILNTNDCIVFGRYNYVKLITIHDNQILVRGVFYYA